MSRTGATGNRWVKKPFACKYFSNNRENYSELHTYSYEHIVNFFRWVIGWRKKFNEFQLHFPYLCSFFYFLHFTSFAVQPYVTHLREFSISFMQRILYFHSYLCFFCWPSPVFAYKLVNWMVFPFDSVKRRGRGNAWCVQIIFIIAVIVAFVVVFSVVLWFICILMK